MCMFEIWIFAFVSVSKENRQKFNTQTRSGATKKNKGIQISGRAKRVK